MFHIALLSEGLRVSFTSVSKVAVVVILLLLCLEAGLIGSLHRPPSTAPLPWLLLSHPSPSHAGRILW